MKRVCAWCNVEMDTVASESESDGIVTHGICDDCANKVLWPHRPDVMDFLDSLDAPIIVVDSLGNALDANKQAQTLMQKESAEICGLKGGVVFECVFAKLPEGCGNTVHCDGCTIRNTVIDTFQSGMSHLNVTAGLTRGSAENLVEIQFQISTEKVGGVVLLRIDKVDPVK